MGTVSQLGFMIAVLGLGSPESSVAGCVVLLAHGLYKAAAFMVVGILVTAAVPLSLLTPQIKRTIQRAESAEQ